MASLYKRGDVFWVKYYRPGQRKPVRASLDVTDEAKARKKLKHLEGELASGRYIDIRVERIRFGSLLDLVLADYRNSERKSIAQVTSRIEGADGAGGHIRPHFGDRRAITINAADISLYIDKRKTAGGKNSTINRELDIINKAFTLGSKAYGITPLKTEHLRESNARTGFLDRPQVVSICRRLPEWCASVVWFGFWTGWRISEIRSLEWRNVDFDGGEIRLDTSKNEEGRVIRMTGELRTLLETNRTKQREAVRTPEMPVTVVTAAPTRFVFARFVKKRRTFLPIGDIDKRWQRACRDAGLSGRIFHDLRRSAVRVFTRAGIVEGVAMKMTGHKTRDVFERYNIVSGDDLAEAAAKLDKIAGTSAGTKTNGTTGN